MDGERERERSEGRETVFELQDLAFLNNPGGLGPLSYKNWYMLFLTHFALGWICMHLDEPWPSRCLQEPAFAQSDSEVRTLGRGTMWWSWGGGVCHSFCPLRGQERLQGNLASGLASAGHFLSDIYTLWWFGSFFAQNPLRGLRLAQQRISKVLGRQSPSQIYWRIPEGWVGRPFGTSMKRFWILDTLKNGGCLIKPGLSYSCLSLYS